MNIPPGITELNQYLIDCAQRCILFWDVLRQRGNQYIEHINAGSPPVLIFDYEIIVDGRTLKKPVNYALVSIIPPKDVKVDPNKRPFLIVDPRAGHGAGIGGFKDDSQVGVALRAGYPVYFVIFFPEPEPDQTLRDIAVAEKIFADKVKERHPNSPKPCIIGNCQGGWAVMMLAAAVPGLAGGLVINGAPLSYWAGENGKNPMRYLGGLLGGSWVAQFVSDLGNGRFDGANLVSNFESLDPANTYWEKYYNLFTKVDTEEKRFLDFEKWWGSFYLLNTAEIKNMIDSLFIGNYLVHGKIPIDHSRILDLRKITSPIIIFCSEGDNITPPQQALNWITDIYHTDLEIKEARQTIVYLVHRDVGHLGIFVSSSVVTKEHKEIVDLLEYIDIIPSGLYEMIIEENPNKEPGQPQYHVFLEERSIQDIKLRSKSESDTTIFEMVRRVSKYNSMSYDLFCGWLIRLLANEFIAELLRQIHPMRFSRYSISDYNPMFKNLSSLAAVIREVREPIEKDNEYLQLQGKLSKRVVDLLNNYRDARDQVAELIFNNTYGTLATLLADVLQKEHAFPELKDEREHAAQVDIEKAMTHGGPNDAIIRTLLLVIRAQGFVHGARVANIRAMLIERLGLRGQSQEIREKIHAQSFLVAYDTEKATLAVPRLIKNNQEREFVLKVLRELISAFPLLSEEAKHKWEEIEQLLEKKTEKSGKKKG